jgi:hypothetical protein
LLLVHCGTSTPSEVQPLADAGTPESGMSDALGGPDASASDPCSAAALEEPRAPTNYYVAAGEPGADDTTCDGKVPTLEASGRCPFKTLDAIANRGLIVNGARSVRVALRAGRYLAKGWNGFGVAGGGTNPSERVVLTRYRDEKVVIDIGSPDGSACALDGGVPADPACVRQTLNIGGSYTVVQGLTIQNGLGYDVQIAGDHHWFRCNKLQETADFPQRADQLKLLGSDIEVRNNEFTKWRSQAIDMTGASNLTIEDNDFHDPTDKGCGANGIKFGTHDVVVRRNRVHDIQSAHCSASALRGILGGGGTGSPHQDEFTARRIRVVENRIFNVNAPAGVYSSCEDCTFEKNDVVDAKAGVWIQNGATGHAGCATSATGCKPSAGIKVTNNRFRGMTNGAAGSQEVFVAVDQGENAGLAIGENVYCATRVDDARFGWEGNAIPFPQWTSASATDGTSSVVPLSDARCGGW